MHEYAIGVPSELLTVEISKTDRVGDEDLERITDFVLFNGKFNPAIITRVEGRSVFFPMIVPIGVYDTIQISGAGYQDIGFSDNSAGTHLVETKKQEKYIRPPKKDPGDFTHTTYIIQEGRRVELAQHSPLGSYSEKAAMEKFRNTVLGFNLVAENNFPFLVPLPITKCRYIGYPDGNGGQQSALVFSCPLRGGRMGDVFASIFSVAIRCGEKDAEAYVTEQFNDVVFPSLHATGKAARFLHQQGYCHYQMTLGNVSPALAFTGSSNTRVCLYDWETLQKKDETAPGLACAYDMSVTVASLSGILRKVFLERLNLPPLSVARLGYSGLLYYLGGYTGNTPLSLYKELDSSRDEIVISSLGSNQEILNYMALSILPRLGIIQ